MFPGTAGTGTTIGVRVRGNGGGGPAEVRDVTANRQRGHAITARLQRPGESALTQATEAAKNTTRPNFALPVRIENF